MLISDDALKHLLTYVSTMKQLNEIPTDFSEAVETSNFAKMFDTEVESAGLQGVVFSASPNTLVQPYIAMIKTKSGIVVTVYPQKNGKDMINLDVNVNGVDISKISSISSDLQKITSIISHHKEGIQRLSVARDNIPKRMDELQSDADNSLRLYRNKYAHELKTHLPTKNNMVGFNLYAKFDSPNATHYKRFSVFRTTPSFYYIRETTFDDVQLKEKLLNEQRIKVNTLPEFMAKEFAFYDDSDVSPILPNVSPYTPKQP